MPASSVLLCCSASSSCCFKDWISLSFWSTSHLRFSTYRTEESRDQKNFRGGFLHYEVTLTTSLRISVRQ